MNDRLTIASQLLAAETSRNGLYSGDIDALACLAEADRLLAAAGTPEAPRECEMRCMCGADHAPGTTCVDCMHTQSFTQPAPSAEPPQALLIREPGANVATLRRADFAPEAPFGTTPLYAHPSQGVEARTAPPAEPAQEWTLERHGETIWLIPTRGVEASVILADYLACHADFAALLGSRSRVTLLVSVKEGE